MANQDLDEEGWFDLFFDEALKDLNPRSTVGMCSFRRLGQTVEMVLGGNPREGTADPERVNLLRQAVWQRFREPGSPDPIRVFVKHEPHKVSKLEEGRLRLISAVSLVDAMVDRVLFLWLAKSILERFGTNPMAVGWSPLAGGHRWVSDAFRGYRKTRSLDMTAWDWTMPGWLILAIKDVIKDLLVCAPGFWGEKVDARWEALFRDAWFCFGDGSLTQQRGWGIMKSGCYLTIIMNTISQLVRHSLVTTRLGLGYLPTIFLGDDQTIVDFPRFQEYEAATRSLGFLLKDSVVEVDRIGFAGFVVEPRAVYPEYREKHVFLITHSPDDALVDRLWAYQILYAFDTRFYGWIERELARLSPALVIKRWHAIDIFNGRRSFV